MNPKAPIQPNKQVPRDLLPEIARVAQSVNLEAVRLVNASAELIGMNAGEGLNELDLQIEAGGKVVGESLKVLFEARFAFRPSKESTKVLVRLGCRYLLDYRIKSAPGAPQIGESLAEAFAATNGLMNAWPYVREYCQSTLCRMQLATVILPSLRSNYMVDSGNGVPSAGEV